MAKEDANTDNTAINPPITIISTTNANTKMQPIIREMYTQNGEKPATIETARNIEIAGLFISLWVFLRSSIDLAVFQVAKMILHG